jgi:hypothetical protein
MSDLIMIFVVSEKMLAIMAGGQLHKFHSTDNSTLYCSYTEALKAVEGVLEITWEILNTGHWSKVPLAPRQLYTAAAIIKVSYFSMSVINVIFEGPEKE